MSEGNRRAAESTQGEYLKVSLPGQKLYLRFVVPPRNMYHKFYNIFCNPLLWFLQHQMWNPSYTPNIDARIYDAWDNGYIPVNQAFAAAIIAEAKQSKLPPLVMLQDHYLYLAGGYIRDQMPDAILQHFTHIPWPAPRYWQLLPGHIRRAILEGLCAADIVGLQTRGDAHSFLACCEELLNEAEVDYQNHTVWTRGHLTQVQPYPVSIDIAELERLARSPLVKRLEERLRPYLGEQTIVRVDRAEPSKNIVRGLRAFAMLLQCYPHLMGKVKLILFLTPSSPHIKLYQKYTQEIMEMVAQINTEHGSEQWEPIKIFHENNYPQAIAGMRSYDVLMVNPVSDGMNLVAKEGPLVNTKDGILILSETAGAYEQLRENVLSVACADLEGTAQALYAALTMDAEERERRAQALRKKIEAEDIATWLYWQFDDLRRLVRGRAQEAIKESAP